MPLSAHLAQHQENMLLIIIRVNGINNSNSALHIMAVSGEYRIVRGSILQLETSVAMVLSLKRRTELFGSYSLLINLSHAKKPLNDFRLSFPIIKNIICHNIFAKLNI
jgi:hypothetical protein